MRVTCTNGNVKKKYTQKSLRGTTNIHQMKRAWEEGVDTNVLCTSFEFDALSEMHRMLQASKDCYKPAASTPLLAEFSVEMDIAACPRRRGLLEASLKTKDDKFVRLASQILVLLSRHVEARQVLLQRCQAGLLHALSELLCTAGCLEVRGVALALSSLVSGTPDAQKHVCFTFPGVVPAASALMAAPGTDAGTFCGCAWLLYHLARDSPAIQTEFVERYGILDLLVGLLGSRKGFTLGARGVVAWTLQATVSNNKKAQRLAQEKRASVSAFAFLEDANASTDASERVSATSSAIWVLGALAHEMEEVQLELRLHSAMFTCLLAQFECPESDPHIHYQACITVYALAINNPGNQDALGQLSCVEALFKVLDAPWRSSDALQGVIIHAATEKVLSAILCLIINHAGNQARAVAVPRHRQLLVQLLDSPASKIRGVAAGLIRLTFGGLLADDSLAEAHAHFLALGVLSALTRMILRAPSVFLYHGVFAQEQACAAMYNFARNSLSVKTFDSPDIRAAVLHACVLLVASSVTAASPKHGGSSAMALSHAILTVLFVLNKEDPTHAERCVANPVLLECPDEVLAAHAWHLLKTICPEEREGADGLPFMVSVMRALAPITRRHGAADAHSAETCCGICMEEFGGCSGTAAAVQCDGGDDEVYSPCFHSFHRACILKWVCIKDECPKCRQPVIRNIRKMEMNVQ